MDQGEPQRVDELNLTAYRSPQPSCHVWNVYQLRGLQLNPYLDIPHIYSMSLTGLCANHTRAKIQCQVVRTGRRICGLVIHGRCLLLNIQPSTVLLCKMKTLKILTVAVFLATATAQLTEILAELPNCAVRELKPLASTPEEQMLTLPTARMHAPCH